MCSFVTLRTLNCILQRGDSYCGFKAVICFSWGRWLSLVSSHSVLGPTYSHHHPRLASPWCSFLQHNSYVTSGKCRFCVLREGLGLWGIWYAELNFSSFQSQLLILTISTSLLGIHISYNFMTTGKTISWLSRDRVCLDSFSPWCLLCSRF